MKVKRKIQGYAKTQYEENHFFSWSVDNKRGAYAFLYRARKVYNFEIKAAYYVEKLSDGTILINEKIH